MKQRHVIVGILTMVGTAVLGCSSNGVNAHANTPPVITSDSIAPALAGDDFEYTAQFADADGPDTVISYLSRPSWLSENGARLSGTPGLEASDTSFLVIASDGMAADTLRVNIVFVPSIVVYGDTRTDHTVHRQVVKEIARVKPVAVFVTGDMVENGLISAQWDVFNSITAELRKTAPFYPALGNHENQSPLYFENFVLPNNEEWYSVDKNSIHFIVLNSCVASDSGSEQYRWLEADLASVPDTMKFVAALFHHPAYSTGPHGPDEKGLIGSWVPLFEKYGVKVVFAGHNHCYERSLCGGIFHIVTGGGGAPLHAQARQDPCSQLYLKRYNFCRLAVIGDRLIVNVYDAGGERVDRFEIGR